MAVDVTAWPTGGDPVAWLAVIEEAEADRARLLEAHASIELDGDAATFRRALDSALGRPAPLLVEAAPGQVVELDPDDDR